MKASRTLIAIAIAALIPVSAAMAGDKEKDKSPGSGVSFDKLDANRDGRISQAEAAVDSKIVFSTADANGDGYIDSAEWKASSKGSTSPTPHSEPVSPTDPTMPQTTEPASTPQPDTETPRQ